jgi:hypothetical protein
MTTEPVVETNGLGKSYGKTSAVRELNLTVGPAASRHFSA